MEVDSRLGSVYHTHEPISIVSRCIFSRWEDFPLLKLASNAMKFCISRTYLPFGSQEHSLDTEPEPPDGEPLGVEEEEFFSGVFFDESMAASVSCISAWKSFFATLTPEKSSRWIEVP